MNPYNSRITYDGSSIASMASSLEQAGQLVAAKARPSPSDPRKYQLIYGHRRFLAAKKLGWSSMRIEIVDADNQQMIEQSLIENLEHDGISDYEKALVFERMNREMNKTYDEIGKLIGISKQHVSNYIAMLRLFDQVRVNSNAELFEAVKHVTEHHARILSRVEDSQTREELAMLIFREKLSVKELSNLVGRLRSWFPPPGAAEDCAQSEVRETLVGSYDNRLYAEEMRKIKQVLYSEFELVRQGDFDSFKNMHMFGEGYSLYGAFPPLIRYDDDRALPRERMWFYEIAPSLDCKIGSVKIDIFGTVALATLIVDYSGIYRKEQFRMRSRGTVVLLKKENNWKIYHEHWSAGSSTHIPMEKAAFAKRSNVRK